MTKKHVRTIIREMVPDWSIIDPVSAIEMLAMEAADA